MPGTRMQSCAQVEGGGVPLLITIMAGNKSAQKGESAGEDEWLAKTAVVWARYDADGGAGN